MPTAEDRVVLLTGKELFLRTEHTDAIRRSLQTAHGEVETAKFEGASCDPAEVLDECRSFGLMAPHKLIVVDDADQFVREHTRPMLERYCESPSDQATLVLRSTKWNRGNLDKAIAKVGLIVKCDEVDPGTAARWIRARAEKKHDARIDQQTANTLVERTGSDLGRLDTELGKLAAAAGQGGTITPGLIQELVGLTREEEAWAMQSELLSGNPERLLSELRIVMGNGSRDASVPVSYTCCDLARKLVGAAEGLRQRVPPMKLAKDLAIWGPSQGPIFDAAKRMGPDRARELFDAAIAVDAGIKSGLDAEIAIERLALKFAGYA